MTRARRSPGATAWWRCGCFFGTGSASESALPTARALEDYRGRFVLAGARRWLRTASARPSWATSIMRDLRRRARRGSGGGGSSGHGDRASYLVHGARVVRLRLPDGGRRPARRAGPAQPHVPPHARAVGRVLQDAEQRAAAVAPDQRHRAGAAGGLRHAGGPVRESLSVVGYVGAAVLVRRAAWRWCASPARRSSCIRWSTSGGACVPPRG